MHLSLPAVIAVARKEFFAYLKTKRLIVIGGLYAVSFLLSVVVMSYYQTPDVFRELLANGYSITSIFYVVLPIVLSYDLIAREQSRKSIFLLLSKPVNRVEVAIGKFGGIFGIICAVLIPIATVGHVIAASSVGIEAGLDIGRAYAFLGVLLLEAICYISLSMLFSTVSGSTATSLIGSILVGWFGLNFLYPVVSLFYGLAGYTGSGPPLGSKIAFLLSPANNASAAMELLSDKIMGISGAGQYPVSVTQALAALVIFPICIFAATLYLFHQKELT